MKYKLSAIGIATAAALTLFAGVAPASAAGDPAAQPVVVTATEEAPRPGCVFPYDRPFPWSQVGIVDDAARVIGMPKVAVCEALDHGRSLVEIARAHGTSEHELKRGILAGQWNDLMHRVRNTAFTFEQAVRHYNELVAHIDVIVNHHS